MQLILKICCNELRFNKLDFLISPTDDHVHGIALNGAGSDQSP